MILENWSVENVTEEEFMIWGYVYGDTKGRFYDGQYIHTSGIKYGEALDKGSVVNTRNSTYTLGTPFNFAGGI